MRRKSRMIGAVLLSMSILLAGCAGSQNEETDSKGKDGNTAQESVQEKTSTREDVRELKDEKAPVFISEGIRRIQVSAGGETLYSIEYAPREMENSYEYWKMAVPYENKAIVDTEAMTALYDSAESLDFTPVETAADIDTGLETPVGEIELDFCQTTQEVRKEALTKEQASGAQPDAKEMANSPYPDSTCTLLVGKSDGEEHYYTALKSAPEQIYKMNSSTIDSMLNAQPFSLILKVGTVVAVNTVEQINITMDQKEYQMHVKDDEFYFGDTKTEESKYHTLYTELLSVLLDSELPKEAASREEALLEMEFVRNSDKAEDVVIKYYPYDDHYAVLSQDGVEKFLVKLEDVTQLKQTIKASMP